MPIVWGADVSFPLQDPGVQGRAFLILFLIHDAKHLVGLQNMAAALLLLSPLRDVC